MAEIELVFTLTTVDDAIERDQARQQKRKEDQELLDKIKAYGHFNEDGEWEQ